MFSPGIEVHSGLMRPPGNLYKLNYQHPFMKLNPRVLGVAHGNRVMFDYVTGRAATPNGNQAPRWANKIGVGLDCNGTNGYAQWDDNVNVSMPVVTMFAVLMFDTAAANRDFVCDTGATNAGRRFRYNNTSGTIELFNGGVASGNIDSGIAPVTGQPYFMGVIADKTSGQAAFAIRNLNTGVLQYSTATNTTTPTSGDSKLTIGGGPAIFDGVVAMGGIAQGFMRPTALIQWSANPWSVFEQTAIPIHSAQTAVTTSLGVGLIDSILLGGGAGGRKLAA